MHNNNFLFAGVLIMFFMTACTQKSPENEVNKSLGVIPLPEEINAQTGNFTIQPGTKILYTPESEEVKAVADFFADLLKSSTGYDLKVEAAASGKASKHNIVFSKEENSLKEGGYFLSVKPKTIVVRAASSDGLFYGLQTLRQLLPVDVEDSTLAENVSWAIPCVEIKDEPRYPYRGLHLDVGRHFFPAPFIKKYLDLMALYKMNYFHWHLTEDQGWRIEIKKYPELTKTGAYRKETLVGHYPQSNQKYDGTRYGGFYTQEEIKDIVAYAKKLHITVIPEIEMPGHSLAALASYPELGCTGGPYEVGTRWGVFKDVYCAGNEETFHFLEDILTEVMDLFPSKYIHIGGDECPKDRWKECDKCQARIKAEGLKDEHELQSYFIKRIEKFLNAHGREIIGWDEILEGGLAPGATVMSWRGIKGGIEAAKQNHDVIMTPSSHCYFDQYQGPEDSEPLAIGGFVPLEKVYSYEPTPKELNEQEAKHILGAQGNVWTEYIATPDYAEYMVYPRACALAEVGWSPKVKRNYSDFLNRLKPNLARLKILGVNYRPLDKVKEQ